MNGGNGARGGRHDFGSVFAWVPSSIPIEPANVFEFNNCSESGFQLWRIFVCFITHLNLEELSEHLEVFIIY